MNTAGSQGQREPRDLSRAKLHPPAMGISRLRRGKEGNNISASYKEVKRGISFPVREDRAPVRLIGNSAKL